MSDSNFTETTILNWSVIVYQSTGDEAIPKVYSKIKIIDIWMDK